MARYHISPDGVARVCRAPEGHCRFGGEHYSSRHEAQQASEQQFAAELSSHGSHNLSAMLDGEIQQLKSVPNSDSPEWDEVRSAAARHKKKLDGGMAKMRIEQVIDQLREPDGGWTVRLETLESPTSGFCYSPYPERGVVIESTDLVEYELIEEFNDSNEDLLDREDHFVGAWHDPETGKIYLDVSVVVDDAKNARTGCQESDQIAFFDLQTYESVDVDREATGGSIFVNESHNNSST